MPPGAWPLVGRDDELVLARAALAASDSAGLVISGAPGVGKTRMADELLAEQAVVGRDVLRLMATRAAATIPFGAAATLLGEVPSPAGRGEPTTLIAAQEAIARRATGRRLVIGVDDAHLLDEATAELIYHLAAMSQVRVVLTVRRADRAPAPIDALRHDHRFHRLDLQPLSQDEVTELLEQALGGQVERHSAENLWRVTAGNVLFLRELCRDAADRGALVRRHGVWTWSGGPVLGTRLQELLDGRVGGLSGPEREAAALLAVGEPLPRSLLADLADEAAIDELTRRGLLSDDQGDKAYESTMRLSHPLYAEGLRVRLGPLESTDLYARLADGLAARGIVSPDDRLRVAVWSLSSGRPVDTELLATAARDALTRGDAALAERLARPAADVPEGVLVLGEALAALRRGPEAEAVLAPLAEGEPDAADGGGGRARLTVAVCVARLAAHRSPDLPLDAAHELAAVARAATGDPDDVDLIDAALVDTLSDRGRSAEAGPAALGLLRSTNPAARVLALGAASTWLVQSGRSEEAVAACREALTDALAHQRRLAWAPSLVVGHLGTALLSTGRLDELAELCEAAKAPPLAPTGRGLGVVALLQGSAALVRGQPRTARAALREAVLSFERTDAVGRHARSLALLAEAEALLGDVDGARRTLQAMSPNGISRGDFDRQRAELCVLAAEGDVRGAGQGAMDLADTARRVQAPFFELAMAYTAMRFGAPDAAARVEITAADLQGAIAAAFGAHGAALARDDAVALERAAGRLDELGCRLLAAEAMTHAALAFQRDGIVGRARAATAAAQELRDQCEGARTPLLSHRTLVADLTRREREVALLAAGGMTSREIGGRLGISVRTVDNQLGRVYTKLNVSGRAALAQFLDG